MTESEQFWNDRFHEALESWRANGILDDKEPCPSSGDLDSTANFDPGAKINVYADETLDETMLQSATFVEEHLASLDISNNKSQQVLEEEEDGF